LHLPFLCLQILPDNCVAHFPTSFRPLLKHSLSIKVFFGTCNPLSAHTHFPNFL
jgi:hypothetical protein